MTAQRKLGEATSALSKSYERLSSGQRINRASDDAAGLSIASALNSQSRVLSQGTRNFNDGISALNIADSAIQQLSGIVTRLKELSAQAANGTYGSKQRKALDDEAQALAKEYFRISASTSFNGISLFNGSAPSIRLQGGYGINGGIEAGVGGAIGTGAFCSGDKYTFGVSGPRLAYTLSLGDINGDGLPDLVTGGTSNGGIELRMARGDGTFGSTTIISMTADANEIALGDINGDGSLDIAAMTMSSVDILINKGDGTFQKASSCSMTDENLDITLSDLNNDGNLDILSAGADYNRSGGRSAGIVGIRFGQGNGSFGTLSTYDFTPVDFDMIAVSVRAADLNGDGNPDLVGSGAPYGQGTWVRLGTGNGTFGAALASTGLETNRDSALADLNNDGKLDLITVGFDSESGSGSAMISLGHGDGTFGDTALYVEIAGGECSDVAMSDLNGDGFLDMVTCGFDNENGYLTTSLGKGDGTLGKATTYKTEEGRDPTDLAIGDTDGDGVLDILTATGAHGADSDPYDIKIFRGSTISGVAPLLAFSLSTMADARQAMSLFEQKLGQLAQQRGVIGGFQSRIASAVSTLQAAGENYKSAASRIEDVDVASESVNLLQKRIVQQAAAAVLAQANQQPSVVLQLLQ